MRLTGLLGVVLVALAAGAVAAGAVGQLKFAVVTSGSSADHTPVAQRTPFASIVRRIVDDPIDRPNRPTPVDYRRFFGVYVLVYRPTSGYRLAVRRLTLQRRGPAAQVCAIVQITRPAGAVAQVLSHVYAYVKVRRSLAGTNIPAGIVVRESNGKLVYRTTVGQRTNTALCHP